MPCKQSATSGGTAGAGKPGGGGYTTEAECLKACGDGACCEAGVCSVKPACLCKGTGQVFQGVGTTCGDISGACCDASGAVPACSVVASCECTGPGKTFLGVGTTCDGTTGACCETVAGVTTCTPRTSCECTGPGKVFKGNGTTCGPLTCACACADVKHPTTVTWSLVVHKFDFRPFAPPEYDQAVYGAYVRNGYSCSGTFTLAPQLAGGGWEDSQTEDVRITPDYLLRPDQDPSNRGGNYLRIPDTMPATVTYKRCLPGVYRGVGPHLSVYVHKPAGEWNVNGSGFSDENQVNDKAPSFTTEDGTRWQDIKDPFCGNVCVPSITWSQVTQYLDESSGGANPPVFTCPLSDFTISITGCPNAFRNPLP
jgi:hypothetical protein